jgi:hypothetical protein
LGRLGYFTIASDSEEPVSHSLCGKHLSDYVELTYEGQNLIGKIRSITKTAGLVIVPPLGGIKEAIVFKVHGFSETVTKGQLLFTLKSGDTFIDIHAPISGFRRGAVSSAYEGATTRTGNLLARIDYGPMPIMVRYSLVKPTGLPVCLRVDYAVGYPLKASEWVCPDAPGMIGDKGRRWWLERYGTVPATPEEGLRLAKTLPAPFKIDVQDSYSSQDGPPAIHAFWYSSNIDGKELFLSATNSVVLPNADKEQLANLQIRPVDPFESYPDVLCPPPSWWPSIPRNMEVLPDPFDRKLVSIKTKSILRQYLELSRSRIIKWRNRPPSTTSAVINICMAYTLSELPLPQELCAFFFDSVASERLNLPKSQTRIVCSLECNNSNGLA